MAGTHFTEGSRAPSTDLSHELPQGDHCDITFIFQDVDLPEKSTFSAAANTFVMPTTFKYLVNSLYQFDKIHT